MLCRNELLTGDNQKCFTLSHLHAHTSLHLSTINLAHLYNLSLLPSCTVPLSCHFLTEDTSECPAGPAESRSAAAGWALWCWCHQRMCWKGGPALAAANAEDGGQAQAGQCLGGLLQNLWAGEQFAIAYSLVPFCQLIRASVVLRYPQPTNTNASALPHGSGGGCGFSTLTTSAEGLLLAVDLTALAKWIEMTFTPAA